MVETMSAFSNNVNKKNYKEEYKEEQLKGWGGREVHENKLYSAVSTQISHDLCPLDCLKK